MGLRWIKRGVIPLLVGTSIGFSLSLFLRYMAVSCKLKTSASSSEISSPVFSYLSQNNGLHKEPDQVVNLISSEDAKLKIRVGKWNDQQNFLQDINNDLVQDKQNLVLVGVMTAQKFLHTRAVAVYETWGQRLPGKVIFFTGGNATKSEDGEDVPLYPPRIPLVALPGVDDSYPPQKKSFMMLK